MPEQSEGDAFGRLILLYDPDGDEAWHGTTRLVSYIQADVDESLAADSLLPEVAWSWLVDALAAHGEPLTALGGTVTATTSVRFGDIAGPGRAHQLELRASWTPQSDMLTPHVEAFCDVLAYARVCLRRGSRDSSGENRRNPTGFLEPVLFLVHAASQRARCRFPLSRDPQSAPPHLRLIVLDPSTVPGGYDYVSLRNELEARLTAVPQFRMKLADSRFNLDHPVWVDDHDFDLDRHVHHVGVPAPGGRTELADLCGHIAAQPLDRSRPLWEMWFVGGLDDGRIAVIAKMHHAGVDGSPVPRSSRSCAASTPPIPGPNRCSGVPATRTTSPSRSPEPSTWRAAPAPAADPPGRGHIADSWIARARRGDAMPAPFTAPRTPFNSTITGHRNVGFAELNLDDVKLVKNVFGVTVNDVVMAVCSGALRRYLERRGELPDSPLIGMIPVSVHGRSDRPGRNQVSAMFADLHTHIADPAERLRALAEANAVSKEHNADLGANLLQDWSQFLGAAVFAPAMRAYAGLRLADRHPVIHNLVISNVPGPPVPLYFLGARMTAMYPSGRSSRRGAQRDGALPRRQARHRPDLVSRSRPRPVGTRRRLLPRPRGPHPRGRCGKRRRRLAGG